MDGLGRVAGQSQASFEEAFPQACWLSPHLLWGDGQSLCCLMATSSATRGGCGMGTFCSSKTLTVPCLQQDQRRKQLACGHQHSVSLATLLSKACWP